MPDRLEAMIWIRKNQIGRRNLTDDQRAMNAAGLAELESEKVRREQIAIGESSTTPWVNPQRKPGLLALLQAYPLVSNQKSRQFQVPKENNEVLLERPVAMGHPQHSFRRGYFCHIGPPPVAAPWRS